MGHSPCDRRTEQTPGTVACEVQPQDRTEVKGVDLAATSTMRNHRISSDSAMKPLSA